MSFAVVVANFCGYTLFVVIVLISDVSCLQTVTKTESRAKWVGILQ